MENKISSVSSLVKKKTDHNTEITEIEKKLTNHNHGKYITTPNARLAQENLITKPDFDAKLSSLNRKVTANKTKHLLENEMKKLKTFYSSYFIGKSYFEEDVTQNYLVFQPMYRYFKIITCVGNGRYIYYWQCKGLSDEKINCITAYNYSVTPFLDYYGTERVELCRNRLKQDQVTFNHEKIVNIYIFYETRKGLILAIIQH